MVEQSDSVYRSSLGGAAAKEYCLTYLGALGSNRMGGRKRRRTDIRHNAFPPAPTNTVFGLLFTAGSQSKIEYLPAISHITIHLCHIKSDWIPHSPSAHKPDYDAICQRPYYRYKAAESQSMMWQKAEASGAPSLVLFALPNAPSVAGVLELPGNMEGRRPRISTGNRIMNCSATRQKRTYVDAMRFPFSRPI